MAEKEPSTRLSVEDWLQAGYTVLAEEGVRALKVERLCRQAGVTRGSFYWHFEDRGALLSAMLDTWEQATTEEVAERLASEGGDSVSSSSKG